MDITSVIAFLSQIIEKKPLNVDEGNKSFCEKKIREDLRNGSFNVSSNCFEKIKEDSHTPQSQNDFLIMVGNKDVLILKQNKDKNVPILSIITGVNSKIIDIDFLYPLDNSDYFVVKNKNENKLLVFNYKITGNISPSQILSVSMTNHITKLKYNQKMKEISLFDINGKKEIIKFNETGTI